MAVSAGGRGPQSQAVTVPFGETIRVSGLGWCLSAGLGGSATSTGTGLPRGLARLNRPKGHPARPGPPRRRRRGPSPYVRPGRGARHRHSRSSQGPARLRLLPGLRSAPGPASGVKLHSSGAESRLDRCLCLVPPKLLVSFLLAVKDPCSHQGRQCVVKTVAKLVVRPQQLFGVGLEVLVLKESKRAADEIGGDIPIRPLGQVLRE